MKEIIVLISLFIPFVMNSQTYFKAGMKWRTEVIGTQDPYASPMVEVVTLEQSESDGYFQMYRSYENDLANKAFVAHIKTDGEKVLFKTNDEAASEWHLLYDFGIKSGEGCYVYSPIDNSTPYKTYIKCTGIAELSADGDWVALTLEEYTNESCSELLGHGTWLKGVSSLTGVLGNNRFDIDGMSSKLLEVVDNGITIYSNKPAGVLKITDFLTPNIKIDGLNIVVSTNVESRGSLYSLTGLHIGDYKFNKMSTHISLPNRGIYLLKIGDVVRKIVIP